MKFAYKFLVLILVFCSFQNIANSQSILVIDDVGVINCSNHYILDRPSVILTQDIANRLNKNGKLSAINYSFKAQTNYRRISFDKLESLRKLYKFNIKEISEISKRNNCDYSLIVTSGIDYQSEFLKPTVCNFLNIPGEDTVKPTYVITTFISLIDTKNEKVIFQKVAKENISGKNFSLVNFVSSPNYVQLEKTKKYSEKLSKIICPMVENIVCNSELFDESIDIDYILEKKEKPFWKKKKVEKDRNEELKNNYIYEDL